MKLRLPIRTRLALWFFLVFAAATSAIGIVSLWMVHQGLLALENNELHQRVRGIERFLNIRPADEPLASLEAAMSVYNVTHGGKWLQVVDAHGHWLYRSPHIADIYPTLASPQQAGNREHFFDFTSGTRYVRGLITTIHVRGQAYTVQTGLTLNNRLYVLGDFRLHLLVITPMLLLLAAIAGFFASRKALAPVAAITGEARRITSRNLDTRLPVPDTRDELSDMSETLNQMLDRIDAGYRSVKEFTANAAHELRTPLSLIRAESEIALAFDRKADEYKETLQHIQAETLRMSRLIDDLLALARADAGVQLLRFAPLDLNELLHAAAERWRPQLHNSGIDLRLVLADETAVVLADASSVERLLDILLENARRYSPAGGGIQLLTTIEAEHAVMAVRDEGIGIPAEHQDKIFDRFYRVNAANDGTSAGLSCGPGSGLGLALARWIAELHGTRIEVKSESGRGSCFAVRFAHIGKDATGNSRRGEGSPEASSPGLPRAALKSTPVGASMAIYRSRDFEDLKLDGPQA